MMNIDELQRKWAEMNSRLTALENNREQKKIKNMKTAQEKLAAQYRHFAIAGLLCQLSAFITISHVANLWLALAFAVFFLTAAGMDWWLCRKVSAINVTTMTVSEVAAAARHCRRAHHRCQLVLIPWACILIGLLCYARTDNVFFLWGCATGATIGLCIGLKVYFNMMRQYKNMMA